MAYTNRDQWYNTPPPAPPTDPCNSGNPIGDFFCNIGRNARGAGDALGNTGRGVGDALGNTGRGVGNLAQGTGDAAAAWGQSIDEIRGLLALGIVAVMIMTASN